MTTRWYVRVILIILSQLLCVSWIGKAFVSVSLFAKNISNYPVRLNNRVQMQTKFKYLAAKQNTVFGF